MATITHGSSGRTDVSSRTTPAETLPQDNLNRFVEISGSGAFAPANQILGMLKFV